MEQTFGSGNWTLEQIRTEFSPPHMSESASLADLRRINALCCELTHRILWEKTIAEQKVMKSKRVFQSTRKEIRVSLGRQERASAGRFERAPASELDDTADSFKGDFAGTIIDVPKLQEIYEDANYELVIWEDRLDDVKTTASRSEITAFNISVEGKYGTPVTINKGA